MQILITLRKRKPLDDWIGEQKTTIYFRKVSKPGFRMAKSDLKVVKHELGLKKSLVPFAFF